MDSNIRKMKKGEVIFKEGENQMWMYALLKGSVGIYANYGTDAEKLLVELKAEDKAYFGEMGLIDAAPRSATAVVLEDAYVNIISKENFAEFFRERPADILAMMQNMSKRIRGLTADYLDACRAVAEAVEAEKSGKGKSNWFKNKVSKFIEDYNAYLEITPNHAIEQYYINNQWHW